MDCMMRELDGYQVPAEIRRRGQRGRRIPIVAMTIGAMDGERERCLDAGMDVPLAASDLRRLKAAGGLSFAAFSPLRFHAAVSPPLRLHPADLLALCGSHGP